ncbi:hypothetical protein QYF36_012848 [Acer negundo]|nr:hypothetical protein QYF36_012848 [Acer negundo]
MDLFVFFDKINDMGTLLKGLKEEIDSSEEIASIHRRMCGGGTSEPRLRLIVLVDEDFMGVEVRDSGDDVFLFMIRRIEVKNFADDDDDNELG